MRLWGIGGRLAICSAAVRQSAYRRFRNELIRPITDSVAAKANDNNCNLMPMQHLFRLLLLLTLIVPLTGHAVTLGQARVNSFLGQPLDAEIDLIGLTPGQHEDLRLRIANERHFERMGIVYERHLAELQFDVVRSGRQWLVRARTEKPVTEPFIDFPLQMSWPGGQIIRQYTLLLDPPTRIRTARVDGIAPAEAKEQMPRPSASCCCINNKEIIIEKIIRR